MISSDRKILVPNSSVRQRMVRYGRLFGELHIVLCTLLPTDGTVIEIASNVWVYPTNSTSKLLYIPDAISIGRKILGTVYFGQTVITAQDPFETSIVGVVLKWLFKDPLQIQLHTDAWSVYFQYGSFLNWMRVTLISRITFPYADSVRVVSEKIRLDVVRYRSVIPNNVFVLPIFVDIDRYKLQSSDLNLHALYPQWKTIILMSSRLTKEKNISLALNVMRKLSRMYKDVGLVVVGEGPEEENLRHMVRRFHLGDFVMFVGWQSDVLPYIQSADIFLNTSNFEGYGMTLIEAGAAGKAVLTTEVGVAYDLLVDGKNASVCAVGDQQSIFNELVTLIENPHLRHEMGKQLQQDLSYAMLTETQYDRKFAEGIESLHQK